jgi:CRP-like cAMP-binding protein
MPLIPNILLASLPASAYRDILPRLKPVTLALGEVLYEPGQPMAHVYFPQTCLVSLIVVLEDKLPLEVALVGREGMVGVPLALGAGLSPVRALVQGAGDALRMHQLVFRAALRRHPPLQGVLNGYAHTLMGQIARTAACNRYHLLEARLARWLLMTRDRVESGEFAMTQEFLSTMLAVRRVGVSDAASSFQRRHLIEYSRGHITILDHKGLEAASCSCYASDAANNGSLPPWRPAARRKAA